MFGMMGVFAEFERSMIQERALDWLELRPADKKFESPKIDEAVETNIRKALRTGEMGMHKIAAEFAVGTETVQRIRAEMSAAIR
jgi:DNA invertase Pin-like site-specific DNA recombinase